MKKIGIMGGTFDPIHNGHIAVGRQAYGEYDLDEIWFMPSGHPPHKTDHVVTSVEDRCEMTRLAIKEEPYFRFSDFEARREGNTYTAQTLKLLRENYPDCRFFFIIGADSLYELESWYRPEEVLHMAVILVAGRKYPGAERSLESQISYLRDKYQGEIFPLHLKEMDVASVHLREMAAEGEDVSPYLPAAVWEYIQTHDLYRRRKDERAMNEQIPYFRQRLQEKLPPMRYEHSLGVSYTAMALAMRYGCDLDQAETAGLLHDCAKHYSDGEIIKKCRKHEIELTEAELKAPAVLHAKYGEWLAEHRYGVNDPEILSAIRWHTTGHAGMTVLEKIIYIADYIEPRRDNAPDLPAMRKLAFQDLDRTMYEILKGTLKYLKKKGGNVDPMTEEAYEYFKKMMESGELAGKGESTV